MIRKDILLQFETWMQKLKNKLDSSLPNPFLNASFTDIKLILH